MEGQSHSWGPTAVSVCPCLTSRGRVPRSGGNPAQRRGGLGTPCPVTAPPWAWRCPGHLPRFRGRAAPGLPLTARPPLPPSGLPGWLRSRPPSTSPLPWLSIHVGIISSGFGGFPGGHRLHSRAAPSAGTVLTHGPHGLEATGQRQSVTEATSAVSPSPNSAGLRACVCGRGEGAQTLPEGLCQPWEEGR